MFELEHGEEIANLVRKISSDNQKLGFRNKLDFEEIRNEKCRLTSNAN